MNRDFTQEELDCIKNLFSEDEFNKIIYQVRGKLRRRQERSDKQFLMQEIAKIEGASNIEEIDDDNYDLYKSIVYDYKERKDIKIVFDKIDSYYKLKLKTRNYAYSTYSIKDLLDKLPIIHQGIDDGII